MARLSAPFHVVLRPHDPHPCRGAERRGIAADANPHDRKNGQPQSGAGIPTQAGGHRRRNRGGNCPGADGGRAHFGYLRRQQHGAGLGLMDGAGDRPPCRTSSPHFGHRRRQRRIAGRYRRRRQSHQGVEPEITGGGNRSWAVFVGIDRRCAFGVRNAASDGRSGWPP